MQQTIQDTAPGLYVKGVVTNAKQARNKEGKYLDGLGSFVIETPRGSVRVNLRARLGLTNDQTDEELAQENDTTGDLYDVIPARLWNHWMKSGRVIAFLGLLEQAHQESRAGPLQLALVA